MAAALLVRREALDEIGLFDEEFFIYSEETDLARRLRRAGWRTQYFPEVTVVHHESQFSAGIPERRINEMWRGRHRYWRKHHSAVGARVAALGMGGQYAARALLRAGDRDFAGRMRLHARDAIRVQRAGPSRARGGLEPRARDALAADARDRAHFSSHQRRRSGGAVAAVRADEVEQVRGTPGVARAPAFASRGRDVA